MRKTLAFVAAAATVLAGALAVAAPSSDSSWPSTAVRPSDPTTNATTAAKVELGRRLFYDGRLARDGLRSCAACHVQANAFTDPSPFSWGVTGQHTTRQTPSLANVGFATVLTWANPQVHSLEDQVSGPMFGADPIEMGMEGRRGELIDRLTEEPVYRDLFAKAFPGEAISIPSVAKALAAFERTLVSVDAPYDRYKRGEASAISESAKRGEALFYGERLKCGACHSGPFFTDAATAEPFPFHNTGLYNVDDQGAYPANNTGIHRITGAPADMGRFKTPSLRNIAVTAPYMHDGSLKSLDAVIDAYAAGGLMLPAGQANAGDGRASPLKDSRITAFTLTADERRDLIAFLNALTDERFLTAPELADPWR